MLQLVRCRGATLSKEKCDAEHKKTKAPWELLSEKKASESRFRQLNVNGPVMKMA